MSTHSDAQAHGDRGAHESLNRTAFMATVHCLTGCAIGEVLGMVIGTAAGLSTVATVALSIALAFLFGYTLTSLPLLRSGMALAVVAPIALASDTISITITEIVDNAIIVLIPGAMDAGPGNPGGAISSSRLVSDSTPSPVVAAGCERRWMRCRARPSSTDQSRGDASAGGDPRDSHSRSHGAYGEMLMWAERSSRRSSY
jgi:hypothetical protein